MQLGQQVRRGPQDRKALRVMLAHRAPLVRQDRRVQLGLLDPQAQLVRKARQGHRVRQGLKAWTARKVRRARKVSLAPWVLPGCKGQRVTQAIRGRRACRVQQARLGLLGRRAWQGLKVTLAMPVQPALLVLLVLLVRWAPLGLWGQPGRVSRPAAPLAKCWPRPARRTLRPSGKRRQVVAPRSSTAMARWEHPLALFWMGMADGIPASTSRWDGGSARIGK